MKESTSNLFSNTANRGRAPTSQSLQSNRISSSLGLPHFTQKLLFGFACVVTAGFAGGLYSLSVKRLTSDDRVDQLPLFYLLFIRQWAIFLFNIPFAFYFDVPLLEFGDENRLIWGYITIRSVSSTFALAAGLRAIRSLSLPEFSTIEATVPFITSLLSWPILKQQPRPSDFPLFLFCITGVVFIVRPSFIFDPINSEPPDLKGCIFACISVVMQSLTFVTFGCLRKIPITSVTTIYGFITGCLSLIVVMTFHFQLPPCSSTLTRFEAVMAGLFGCWRIGLVMLASKSLPAALLALDPISELIFQFAWQLSVDGINPHLYSYIGAGIILSAFAFVFIRLSVTQRVRQKLSMS